MPTIEIIFITLLALHILCGSVSLICAGGALSATKGETWHRRFGRFFFYGMTGIFITALPMAMIKLNLFLFVIAFFSYYLAFTGWRFAKNESGKPAMVDWLVSTLMLIIGMTMLVIAWYLHKSNATHAATLTVFGMIGVLLSRGNLKLYLRGGTQGNERLVQHFTSMIGATIAAVTAFLVTTVHLQPAIILWLGPTVLLVPVIVWWRRRMHA
jgi:hypothetical protein